MSDTDTSIYAISRRGLTLDECQFYHTMDIPGVGTVRGFGGGNWDLRGSLDQMLGNVDYAGKRVLEVGPASGHLTFEMERRGADVVAVDAPPEHDWDIIPFPEIQQRWQNGCRAGWKPQTNAWWFAHEHFRSRAKMLYKSGTELDKVDIGTFDVCILSNILLHNRDHLKTIENCAKKTTGTLLIIEQWHYDLEDSGLPLLCLKANAHRSDNWNDWFRFSTAYFMRFLEVMDFADFKVSRYSALWNSNPIEYFTLEAARR